MENLKSELKKKGKEIRSKDSEVSIIKATNKACAKELEIALAKCLVYEADIAALNRRKAKEGTVQILRNLETKNEKLTEEKARSKLSQQKFVILRW